MALLLEALPVGWTEFLPAPEQGHSTETIAPEDGKTYPTFVLQIFGVYCHTIGAPFMGIFVRPISRTCTIIALCIVQVIDESPIGVLCMQKQRGELMPCTNFILLAWIRAKNIKFRYICDRSFVDKWRHT
jgi:hypothetical protein